MANLHHHPMQTIGLLGGMSWESTTTYYRLLNQFVKQEKGGLHSAKIVLLSVDFAEIASLQKANDWAGTEKVLSQAAQNIENAGADFLLIATNTMHIIAEQISQKISIPILHIADATGLALQQAGISKVGLLGTRFTMEQVFYKSHISQHYNIDVIVPEEPERDAIHKIIYDELCQGELKPESKAIYLNIINQLFQAGAQGVILGCTEIALLVQQSDTDVPLFDTTELHAKAAIKKALRG